MKKAIGAHPLLNEHALNFVLGGAAKFTIRSKKTGKRFTYRVAEPKDKKDSQQIFFVAVLTGPDNDANYSFFGIIKKTDSGFLFVYHEKSARINRASESVVAFEYVFNNILRYGHSHHQLEVWHEGACCRCGRTLTVPESIETGIGPECAKIKSSKRSKLLTA